MAFATTIVVFTALLVVASIVVSVATADFIRPLRMTGPAVKRWSGYVLVLVGVWFIVLATLADPILTLDLQPG